MDGSHRRPKLKGSTLPFSTSSTEFASGKHGYIDGMLVIRNGYIVYEKSYTQNYDQLFKGRDQTRGDEVSPSESLGRAAP